MEKTDAFSWTEEQFKNRLFPWKPEWMDNEEALDQVADNLRYEGRYDSFREKFRQMLLDPSRSLKEKALYYFGPDFERDAVETPWGYFKFLWDRLFPQDPFPIAGDPDPPVER